MLGSSDAGQNVHAIGHLSPISGVMMGHLPTLLDSFPLPLRPVGVRRSSATQIRCTEIICIVGLKECWDNLTVKLSIKCR
jgi:hypothetical protein